MATTKKSAKETKKKVVKKDVETAKNTTKKEKIKKELVEEIKVVTVKDSKPKEKEVSTTKSRKKTQSTSKKVGLFKRIKNFFHDVKKELSYVKWPIRKDMVKYSLATICFVLFFSLFFYAIDLVVALVKTWV